MISLFKRFLNFMVNVKSHRKNIVSNMYSVICNDTRSITGSNLRQLMLLTNCNSIIDLSIKHIENLSYHPIENSESWRIEALMDSSMLEVMLSILKVLMIILYLLCSCLLFLINILYRHNMAFHTSSELKRKRGIYKKYCRFYSNNNCFLVF